MGYTKKSLQGFLIASALFFAGSLIMPALAMASSLSQKGFFPTANFTSAWQSYLPADVPVEKLNLYTSNTYVMQPGFQMSVDVYADVVKTEAGFHYTYKLKNAPTSLQTIAVFGLTREAPITAHSGGTLFDVMPSKNPYDNAIGWYPKSDGASKTRIVEMLLGNAGVQIPIVEMGVFPGVMAEGLSVDSLYLPGIVTAFCRGKGWLVKVSYGDFVAAPVNEYVSGKTLGPVLLAQEMDAAAFSKYIQTLVTESISLGWISGGVAVKASALSKGLSATGAEGDPKTTYKDFNAYLNGFWFGTSEMTSEGRSLLLRNLEYGIQRFEK